MAEDFAAIDQALTQPRAHRRMRSSRRVAPTAPAPAPATIQHQLDRNTPATTLSLWHRLVSIETFVAIQLLWGIALFIPGAQGVRGIVRATPYLSSLALLMLYTLRGGRAGRPAGAALIIGALGVLIANLLHAESQLVAGIAQCVFQLCIAAPLFWAQKTVRSAEHGVRILTLIFLFNFASAGLGLLQVYFPDRLLPPQFSGGLDESWLSMMTYVGSGDRVITRPPGLSDVPGGAAVAGALTAILGLGLCLQRRSTWQTAGILAASGVGLAVVYLTQARTILLMSIGSSIVLALLTLKRGHAAKAGRAFLFGGVVVIGAFAWATSLGGDAVEERFLGLRREGAIQAYRSNRGAFLDYTLGELLEKYPLGAGVGRWGMMNAVLGDANDTQSPSLYAEIQLTGWLYDGGIPMWLLYGGAILASLLAGVRLVSSHNPALADMAAMAVAVQVMIVGTAMSGPAFNTQLGIMFWTVGGLLYGASAADWYYSSVTDGGAGR